MERIYIAGELWLEICKTGILVQVYLNSSSMEVRNQGWPNLKG